MSAQGSYGSNDDDIPFDGNMTQLDSSAAQNTDNKDIGHRSEGLADEENDFGYVSFSEADDDRNEDILPEQQPLSVESQSADRDIETPSGETFADADLEPENVEYES